MAASVAAAQAETLAVITALKKGHEELLRSALPKVPSPVFFAWASQSPSVLTKRASETHECYPVHPLGDRVEAARPRAGQSPFNPSVEYDADKWESENHAAFHAAAVLSGEQQVNGTVAGFKNLAGVKQPPFFAWMRLDVGIDGPSEECKSDAVVQTEDEPAEAAEEEKEEAAAPKESSAPTAQAPSSGLIGTCDAPSSEWKSEYLARYLSAAPSAEPPSGPAGSKAQGAQTYPKYYAWRGEAVEMEPAQSEYRGAFVPGVVSRPVKGKQSTEQSLNGIFLYGAEGGPEQSEYTQKFVSFAPSVDADKESAIEASPAPTPAPAAPEAAVPAADAAALMPSEPVDPVPAPAPAVDAATSTDAVAPVETEAPAPDPSLSTYKVLRDAAQLNAAQLFGAGPRSVLLGKSEYANRFSWPAGSVSEGDLPERVNELVGGTMQTAAPGRAVAAALAESKKKFVSEARQMFSWPDRSLAIAAKRPKSSAERADLWVMGHKGRMAAEPSQPAFEGREGAAVAEPAGLPTLPAAAPEASSAVLDSMAAAFAPSATAGTMALPPPVPLEHPVLDSKRIPALREDPVNPVIAQRHKEKDYSELPARFPRNNPQHLFVSKDRDLMPLNASLDPVLAYRRYPSMTDKQMHRWSTESRSSFVFRGKK